MKEYAYEALDLEYVKESEIDKYKAMIDNGNIREIKQILPHPDRYDYKARWTCERKEVL